MPVFGERMARARAMAGERADFTAALLAGVELGRDLDVVQAALHLYDVWNVNPGYAPEGERWLARVEQLGQDCPRSLRARVRAVRGQMVGLLGDSLGSIALLRAALIVYPHD